MWCMNKSMNQKAYSSDHYDKQYYEDNNQSGDRIALRFYARLAKKYCKKGSVLEYGCGSGFFIQKFQPPLFKQFAHDISEYALSQTAKNNPDVTIVKNTKKEIQDKSIDMVAALHLLEHIPQPADVIREFHRMLKDDGVLFVTMPNMSSVMRPVKNDQWFGYRDETHVSLLAPEEWVGLMDAHGFDILSVGSDGLWDVPYHSRIPLVLQKLFYYPTSAVQILANRLFLPVKYGENLVIVARKR